MCLIVPSIRHAYFKVNVTQKVLRKACLSPGSFLAGAGETGAVFHNMKNGFNVFINLY